MVSPAILTAVTGFLDRPARHSYCYLQFVLPAGQEADWLKAAVDNNVEFVLEIAGDRDRDDIDWLTTSLKDILTEALREIQKSCFDVQDFFLFRNRAI
ncbi:hypothetical protein ASG65_16735 [Bacillus sp. Leaf13]|nr:hypothetical protein ASG65_16735 [Bacillus sp. Leaf13]